MRNLNFNYLSAADDATSTGSKIDANQLISASFAAYFGDVRAAGTLKIQGSNEPCPYGYIPQHFTPQHWGDIPSQSIAITSGASALLTIGQTNYRWLRAVFTVSVNPFTAINTIATVADVAGSLNNTYWTFQLLESGGAINYYVWYDDGAGVEPDLPGYVGIAVPYSDNDSANTIGTLTRAAVADAINVGSVSGATNQIIITTGESGPTTAAADGTPPTGFSFSQTRAGLNPTTLNINMNALSA